MYGKHFSLQFFRFGPVAGGVTREWLRIAGTIRITVTEAFEKTAHKIKRIKTSNEKSMKQSITKLAHCRMKKGKVPVP